MQSLPKDFTLENRIIDNKDKITVFDTSSYIDLKRKNIDLSAILRKEEEKGIKSFVSLWVLSELLQEEDSITLMNVNKHCFDKNCGWRFLADPVSQIYVSLYGEEPVYIMKIKSEIEALFNKAVHVRLSKEERENIKLQLEGAGKLFASYSSKVNKISSGELRREVIRQTIDEAKRLRRDFTPITNDSVEFFMQGFPGAGAHYEYIFKNKFQNLHAPNRDKLMHDQRDWTLMFYAGRDNVYVVTGEKKFKTLGLKKVMGLDQYLCEIGR